MAERRHVPIRTCVVCAVKKPKQTLLRLVTDPADGLIAVDSRKTRPGRGAYVCEACLSRLKMNPRVRKAFRNKAKGLKQAG